MRIWLNIIHIQAILTQKLSWSIEVGATEKAQGIYERQMATETLDNNDKNVLVVQMKQKKNLNMLSDDL